MKRTTRVGVVIHYSEANYGNHLVNYAARRILEQCNCVVELIVFRAGRRHRWPRLAARMPFKVLRLIRDRRLSARVIGRVRHLICRRPESLAVHEIRARRVDRFREFSDRYLRPRLVDVADRHALRREFDVFGVGSDQVWNFDHDLGPWHFLDFAVGMRRLCLAPSVGHRKIPREWVKFYAKSVLEFTEIASRESCWVDGLRALVPELPVNVLIDPTLMLAAGEWSDIARAQLGDDRYLLVYELGDFTLSQQQYVAQVAKIHHLSVRRVSGRCPSRLWISDASDFLRLIRDAACVITDSFHGSIFAFQFDRPVVVVKRRGLASGMNSRIETLIESLHLNDRVLEVLAPDDALSHDYSAGREALVGHQRRFWDYLARNGLHRAESDACDSRD